MDKSINVPIDHIYFMLFGIKRPFDLRVIAKEKGITYRQLMESTQYHDRMHLFNDYDKIKIQ